MIERPTRFPRANGFLPEVYQETEKSSLAFFRLFSGIPSFFPLIFNFPEPCRRVDLSPEFGRETCEKQVGRFADVRNLPCLPTRRPW